MTRILPDILLICGAISLSCGAYLAWPPAGLIVAGVLSIIGGVILARAE